ncbi:hypothetical protein NDU88_002753, partial [Pleurodeles waltl]
LTIILLDFFYYFNFCFLYCILFFNFLLFNWIYLHIRITSAPALPNRESGDCFSFSVFSLSVMTSVYKYMQQRTLDFPIVLVLLDRHRFRIFSPGCQQEVCDLFD